MATDRLTIEVEANTSGVDKLNASLKKLNNQLNRTVKTGDNADTGFKKITRSVNGFARSLDRINITPIERLANALQKISTAKIGGTASQLAKAAEAGNKVAEKVNESLPDAQVQTTGAETPTVSKPKVDVSTDTKPLNRLNAKLAQLGQTASKTFDKIKAKAPGAFKVLGKAAQNAIKPLTGLMSVFARMILFNLVFRFLMVLSDAINVGITDLYEYSKAWDNIDWMKTQQNMDDLATTALQVKNTFGVTLMSMIAAIKPLIDALANAFIKAANAINAFFAALSGSATFTKATRQATQFGEATNKAAKAAKNATLGIDELNIISDSSGSGSGAATPDYSKMFEEVEVPSKIKDTVQWLQDHLGLIKLLALEIGAAFLAWKILSAIPSSILGLTGKLGLLLAILGAVAVAWGVFDAWMNGVDWTNATIMIVGVTAVVIGLALAFGPVGAAIGAVVGAIALFVVGLHDVIEKGEMTNQTFVLLEAACAALGVALTIAFGPIGAAIAGVLGLVVAFAKFAQENEEFRKKFSDSIENLKSAFVNLAETIKPLLEDFKTAIFNLAETLQPVLDMWLNYMAMLAQGIMDAIPYIISALTNVVEIITNIINALVALLHGDFEGFFNYLKKAAKSAVDFVTNIFKAWASVLRPFVQAIENMFVSIMTSMSNKVKGIINGIIGFFEGLINGVVNAFNKLINSLNSLSIDIPDWVPEIGGGKLGFNISTWSTVSLPRLATGGMVDAGQLFIANEAGPEMIGTMGGNTTVANNEQIVNGIKGGVMEAVSQVLAPYLADIADNTRETAEKDFSVAIGDRDIARAANRGQKKLGRMIISTT